MNSPLLPPFDRSTAIEKIQRAEDLWNTRDPQKIALAYTVDSQWRNRSEFVSGRQQIASLLERKWARELDYQLRKELFAFSGNRIAVHFEYEYHDDSGQWFRAYGNENWQFDDDGLMHTRDCSINEMAIKESERTLFRA
ncbi:MAG: nuclear transport factor 2 family protein [Halioglobus sp.]